MAEAICLPTSILPRYGVTWRAAGDCDLVADGPIGDEHVTLNITIDTEGHVLFDHLARWGDPDGTRTFGWCPFGITVAASHTFPCGLTMPAEGTGGGSTGQSDGPKESSSAIR